MPYKILYWAELRKTIKNIRNRSHICIVQCSDIAALWMDLNVGLLAWTDSLSFFFPLCFWDCFCWFSLSACGIKLFSQGRMYTGWFLSATSYDMRQVLIKQLIFIVYLTLLSLILFSWGEIEYIYLFIIS